MLLSGLYLQQVSAAERNMYSPPVSRLHLL